MFGSLGLHYLLTGAGRFFSTAFPIFDVRTQYILACSSTLLQIAFFAFAGHFLLQSFFRVAYGQDGTSDDHFSFLIGKNVITLDRRLAAVIVFILIVYLSAAAVFAADTQSFLAALRSAHHWTAGAPPEPAIPGGGFLAGFAGGFLMVIQTQVVAATYKLRSGSRKKSRIASWLFDEREVSSPLVTRLYLVDRPQQQAVAHRKIGEDEWKAFLTIFAGSALWWVLRPGVALAGEDHPAWRAAITLFVELLPGLALLPFIYYKTRFVFFDVVIKRGSIAAALLASSIFYYAAVLSPLQRLTPEHAARAAPVALGAASVLFVALWLAAYGRLDRGLDRLLFRRPEYGPLVVELREERDQQTRWEQQLREKLGW